MSQFKSGFAVGTGRCGTHFIAEVMNKEKYVASSHERSALTDTFHRYCKWNELPVDDAGFIHHKKTAIEKDLEKYQFSFEASAFLSLSCKELVEGLNSKVILIVREPVNVIESYLTKGRRVGQLEWYANPFVQEDKNKALGIQAHTEFHHFLGRLAPKGDEFEEWNELSRVGKLAWNWSNINQRVLETFDLLPKENTMIARIEDIDFEKYLSICDFMSVESSITKKQFEKIRKNKPAKQTSKINSAAWSEQEKDECKQFLGKTPSVFGY